MPNKFLENNFQKFLKFPDTHRKAPVLQSLFNKATGLKVCSFIKKETPTQFFSCEFCKNFKNSFLYGAPPVAASENG